MYGTALYSSLSLIRLARPIRSADRGGGGSGRKVAQPMLAKITRKTEPLIRRHGEQEKNRAEFNMDGQDLQDHSMQS